MLYDKKWDVWSLESLVAWLESKPRLKSYVYGSCDNCLLAQYFADKGFEEVSVSRFSVGYMNGNTWERKDLPPHFNAIAVRGLHRFGCALWRARRAKALAQ